MESPVASKSSPDGTQYCNTPNSTMSDGEHSVARGVHRISYVLLRKDAISVKYYMTFLT